MECRLLKALRAEKVKIEHYVCEGSLGSYDHYRFLCGKIQGYGETIDLCINHFGERDDESESTIG
jgi:hypothetical protein